MATDAIWAPSNAGKGGMLPEGLYDWEEAKVKLWTYPNTDPPQITCALVVKLVSCDDRGEWEQAWSMGDRENFNPTEDGEGVQKVGRRTTIVDSSNLIELTQSLVSSGYPEDRFTGKSTPDFKGLRTHIIHKQVKRNIRARVGEQPSGDRDFTVPVVDHIERLPWQTGAAATSRTSTDNGAAVGPPEEALTALILDLTEKGPVQVAGVRAAAYRQFKERPDKKAFSDLLNDEAFITGLEQVGVVLDGTTLQKV